MRLYQIMAAAAAIGLCSAPATMAEGLPGDGVTVRMAQPTWDTEWFQAQVYRKLLQKLGYTVDQPVSLDNPPFYQAVAEGDVDFWASGWFPQHNPYLPEIEGKAHAVGMMAKGGGVQGYLIDKKTADEHNIGYLEDLQKPENAALFDADGDGKADLVACPPGWGCELIITYQMEAYDLQDKVNAIQATYSASMADALARYKAGEPILFYTWTPNWTVGELKPGTDVVWLQVKDIKLPPDQKDMEQYSTVPGVIGCADDPCVMGWPANDIQVVANNAFLEANPAAAKLLEEVVIPLDAIFAQNAKMNSGESRPEDIERHAQEWVDANPDLVDGWVSAATAGQ